MFQRIGLAFLIAIGLPPALVASPLQGEVSDVEGQTRIQRGDVSVSEQTPPLAPDRRSGSTELQGFPNPNDNEPLVGNVTDFASPARPNRERSPIMAGAENQLSALGVAFKFSNGKVTSVDPGSDVYGQIFPGDRIISYDGMSPVDSYRTGSNFGNAGTVVQLTFAHDGIVRTLPCRRKPVTEFSPVFRSELNWGALRR